MREIGIEKLGGLAVSKILAKLGPKETVRVGCVSHRFQEWACDEFIWSQFCAQELQLSSPVNPLGNPTPSFKAAYQAWRESFGMYPWSLVLRARRCWERIKTWLVVNFPEAVTTLRRGATEDAINNLERILEVKLPLPTRLLYRFCDGQDLVEYSESFSGSLLGLIGGDSFGRHLVNVYLLPLDKVINITAAIRDHLLEYIYLIFGSYLVVAASSSKSKKFIVLNWRNGELSVGARDFLMSGEMSSCVPYELISYIHDIRDCPQEDGMLLWLEEHGRRLENGLIKVREEKNIRYVSLFPEESSLCYTAVTNGVQWNAVWFLPTVSAHWMIRGNDNIVSYINEENVVRKNPVLYPGEREFVYQGCTSLHTLHGSIKGSYTFVPGSLRDPKGAEFEVEIPEIFLEDPDLDYVF